MRDPEHKKDTRNRVPFLLLNATYALPMEPNSSIFSLTVSLMAW